MMQYNDVDCERKEVFEHLNVLGQGKQTNELKLATENHKSYPKQKNLSIKTNLSKSPSSTPWNSLSLSWTAHFEQFSKRS